MQTFSLIPEFEFITENQYSTVQTPFELGYVQTRARWARPKRIFVLNWNNAIQSEKDYIDSFFRDHIGPANSFYYQPVDPISPCYRAGDCTQTAQGVGSYTDRVYYYGITWVTQHGQTTLSTVESFSVAANYLWIFTPVKFLYRSVTSVNIYASAVEGGPYYFQNSLYVSNASYTEIDGVGENGLLVNSITPPSTNTAMETIEVHLLEDQMNISKISAVSYSIRLSFEEVF